jgi:uncharacterized protein (DUF305 family)
MALPSAPLVEAGVSHPSPLMRWSLVSVCKVSKIRPVIEGEPRRGVDALRLEPWQVETAMNHHQLDVSLRPLSGTPLGHPHRACDQNERTRALPRRAVWAAKRLVVLTLALAILASCTGADRAKEQSRPASRGNGPQANASSDAAFLNEMIRHHQQTVEISALAEARAASPEVKAFARRLKAAHDPEVAKVKQVLSGHGKLKEGEDDARRAALALDGQELGRLGRARGAMFNQAFLDAMIVHHERAVSVTQTALREGRSPETVDLARQTAVTAQAELAEAKLLRH